MEGLKGVVRSGQVEGWAALDARRPVWEDDGVLARYQMIRGKRPPESPLPDGLRVDIRKHTRHVLAPAKEDVERYLAAPTEAGFERFKAAYLTLIEARFKADPAPFAALAAEAVRRDVYLGCSCPTAKVPDVRRCHTTLALEFMQSRFPELTVCMPSASR